MMLANVRKLRTRGGRVDNFKLRLGIDDVSPAGGDVYLGKPAKRPLHDPTTTGVLAGQSEDLQRCRR